jgi:hypothetical protein
MMKPGTFGGGSKTKRRPEIMKYALLVHQSQEYFDRRDNTAAMAGARSRGQLI